LVAAWSSVFAMPVSRCAGLLLALALPRVAGKALAFGLNAWAVEQGAQVFGATDGDGEFARDGLLQGLGKLVVIKGVGQCAAVNRALNQQAFARALHRGAGNFSAIRLNHVVGGRPHEALLGAVVRGGWLAAVARAGGELALYRLLRERLADAAVDSGVQFSCGRLRCGEFGFKREAVGPVVAVVDDAAGGQSPAQAQTLGAGGLNLCESLRVAKCDGGLGPAVVPEGRDARRQGVEQRRVDRHIGRCVAKGVG
jgi:hypothetical protein